LPGKCSVEKNPSLDGRDNRHPCEHSNWGEEQRSHSIVVSMSYDLNRLPYRIVLYFWSQNLNNLQDMWGVRAGYSKKEIVLTSTVSCHLILTRRRPQPVGMNARQQMIKSMMDNWQRQ